MKFNELKFKGVYEIIPDSIPDSRGFFMRSYDSLKFREYGLDHKWVQENHSYSLSKGTIRGLHFQFQPFSESKLVRCISGSILNVFVDLRKDSETFGKWDAIELNRENNKMLFIPRGFANAFCILEDNSELIYKTDNFYSLEHEGRLMWNDLDLDIKWPFSNPILSEKDMNNMSYKDFLQKYKYIKT